VWLLAFIFVPSVLVVTYMLVKISPVTDLEWLRGFQEVKVSRFHDNGTGRW